MSNPTRTLRLFLSAAGAFALALNVAPPLRAQTTPPTRPATTEDEAVKLNAFVVTSDADVGYRASNSISGTRLNQKIEDIGQNIFVITEDFIRDLAATSLADVLAYTTGVQADSIGNESSFTVRGFNALRPLRNGVTSSGELLTDSATMQRVEVAKGPSSVLYGVSAPGGLINYVTKEPLLDRQQIWLSQKVGSFSRARTDIDYSQPLGKLLGGPIAIRLMGAYDRDGAFTGNGYKRHVYGASLLWRIRPKAELFVNFERIQQSVNRLTAGILNFTRTGFINLPAEVDFAGDDLRNSSVTFANAQLRLKPNDHWSVRVAGNFHNNPQYFLTFSPNGSGANNAANTNVQFLLSRRTTKFPNYEGSAEAVGNYDFSGVKTTTLIGGEYLFNYFQQRNANVPTALRVNWNLNDRSTWLVPAYFYDPASYSAVDTSNQNRWQEFKGFYADQQVALFHDRLRLTAGFRRDDYHIHFKFVERVGTARNTDLKEGATSPKASIVYTLVPGINLYALVSKSFIQNTSVDEKNNPFPPQLGRSVEGGFKFNFFGGRLSGTTSVYQIHRTNVVEAIPGTNPVVNRAVGEETVDGAEAQIFWSTGAGWQSIGSYSYNDGYRSHDANVNSQGAAIPSVPLHTFSVWEKYSFKKGALKGFAAGLGCVYKGSFQAYAAETTRLRVGGAARVDGLLSYETKLADRAWRFGLNAGNLLDRRYRGVVGVQQPPRNYLLSATVKL